MAEEDMFSNELPTPTPRRFDKEEEYAFHAFMLSALANRPVALCVRISDDILRRIGEVRAAWSPLAQAELDRFEREEE